MHYIVSPLRPPGEVITNAGETRILDKQSKDSLKTYHTNLDDAKRKAEACAKEHPEIQFAVFAPVAIFEAVPPPPPQVVRKKINESGEVVLDKGD